MKILLLIIAVVYAASAVPVDQLGTKEYPRFIDVADHDGVLHKVDLQAEPDMELLEDIMRNPNNNQYLLYTRSNRRISQTLEINNQNSITRSNFNANRQTIIVAHGWLGNMYNDINPTIRDAYLDKSDVNVIVLDWRRLALSDYVTAANGIPAVGRGLGQFLSYLNQVTGAPFNNMHLVGFSLGAHLVGNAGRQLGGRVARMTALDPAGPLWNYNSNRMRASDAVYVEAIHTDGGTVGLGIGTAVGDVDFFPNGGTSQPGCITNLCNHERAWELFAATVTHNHLVGRLCTTNLQVTLDNCRGATLNMGNDNINKRASGMYRVNTARRYPF